MKYFKKVVYTGFIWLVCLYAGYILGGFLLTLFPHFPIVH